MSPSVLPAPLWPHPSCCLFDSGVHPFSLTRKLSLRHCLSCFSISFKSLGREALLEHPILNSNFHCPWQVLVPFRGFVFLSCTSLAYITYRDACIVYLLQHEDRGFALSQSWCLIVAALNRHWLSKWVIRAVQEWNEWHLTIRGDLLSSISSEKMGTPYGAGYKQQEQNALGEF